MKKSECYFSFKINRINSFTHKIGFKNSRVENEVDSAVSSHKETLKNKKIEKKRRKKYLTCNCKNSECLKLYCECFSKNGYCSKNCKCISCKNNADHHKIRSESIKEI